MFCGGRVHTPAVPDPTSFSILVRKVRSRMRKSSVDRVEKNCPPSPRTPLDELRFEETKKRCRRFATLPPYPDPYPTHLFLVDLLNSGSGIGARNGARRPKGAGDVCRRSRRSGRGRAVGDATSSDRGLPRALRRRRASGQGAVLPGVQHEGGAWCMYWGVFFWSN